MAFAVMRPGASQSVVPPFGTERGLVGDKVEHDCLEPMHVVSSALSNRAVPLLIISSDSAMALRVCALGTLSSSGKA